MSVAGCANEADAQPSEASALSSLLSRFAERYLPHADQPEGYSRVAQLLAEYEQAPAEITELTRNWMETGSPSFWPAVFHALRSEEDALACNRLLSSVITVDFLLDLLADPSAFTRNDAIELAVDVARVQPTLDVRLMNRLLEALGNANDPIYIGRAQRTLELVEAVSDGDRIRTYLVMIRRIRDPKIQSKTALLLARSVKNKDWVEQELEDPDPRLRANAVEALWEAAPSEEKRLLLWKAAKDSHHRVVCNALVGLVRMQDDEARQRLEQLATHPSPESRASAAWAMGESGNPAFVNVLRQMVKTEKGSPRRNALRALMRLRKRSDRKGPPIPADTPE